MRTRRIVRRRKSLLGRIGRRRDRGELVPVMVELSDGGIPAETIDLRSETATKPHSAGNGQRT